MNLFLAVAFICAFLSTPAKQISAVRLEVRAVRVIYVAKLRVIHDARNTDDTCHVTDVAAVEGAAKFLDRVTGLHVSRDIHWEYVPLDAAELQRAETAWQQAALRHQQRL